jgi:hypothetical protein
MQYIWTKVAFFTHQCRLSQPKRIPRQ